MGPSGIESSNSREYFEDLSKQNPQSFFESRPRDKKVEEWMKIDSKGWKNYNWYLVLSTLPLKSDLEKNDLLLFGLLYSEISLPHYENPRSSNYLKIGLVSEKSRSNEEKEVNKEREEKSGLPQIDGSTIQDYSLSLKEKPVRDGPRCARGI